MGAGALVFAAAEPAAVGEAELVGGVGSAAFGEDAASVAEPDGEPAFEEDLDGFGVDVGAGADRRHEVRDHH